MSPTPGFRSTLRFIVDFSRPFRAQFAIVFVLILMIQSLALAVPFLSGKFIDALIADASFSTLLAIVGAILALSLLSVGADLLKDVCEIQTIDFRVEAAAMLLTVSKLFGFSLGQHANEHSGLRQAVFSKGQSGIIRLINAIVYQIAPTVLQFIATACALVWLAPSIALLASGFVVVYIALSIYIFRRFNGRVVALREAGNEIGRYESEFMRHAQLVVANAQEEKVRDRYTTRIHAWRDLGETLWVAFCVVLRLRETFPRFMTATIMVAAAYQVSRGMLTVGDLVILLGWSQAMIGSLSSLGHIQRELAQQYAAIEGYVAMLTIPPAVVEVPHPIVPAVSHGAIEFRGVTFRYPIVVTPEEKKDGDPALSGEIAESAEPTDPDRFMAVDGVSFVIPAGATAAIVGHSGAGKSTLVQLLLRGYDPDLGQILIDGNDLRLLSLRDYRSDIGYVEQSVELFDDTLLENILFGVPDAERAQALERIPDVIRRSCLDRLGVRLGTKGLETVIGEKGIRLSGGERQRVGIARALIKDPKIVILDEATSSLDAESEALIHGAIRETLAGRTGIIIAHRLSTIRDADMIIVMHRGTVAAVGMHDELMRASEIYAALVRRQLAGNDRLRLVS